MGKYVKIELEKISLAADEPGSMLILFRDLGEVVQGQQRRADRLHIGVNSAEGAWFLFEALRERVLAHGQEIAELKAHIKAPAKKVKVKK